MHPDMFHPLLVMILGFYCFYAVALCLAVRVEILNRERRSQWVRDVIGQADKGNRGIFR
jgi:heme exporter protein C